MKNETKDMIINAIKERTKDKRDEVKMQALQALSLFEEANDASISDLVSMVIEGDKRQRATAAATLIGMGEKAVPEVIERLVKNDDDLDARMQGIAIITDIYGMEKEKSKVQEKREADEDPHGLGPIIRRNFRKVLVEIFQEAREEAPKA